MDQFTEGTAFALQEMRKGTSFDEIRRLLVEQNYSPDEVNSIMKMADHMYISQDFHKIDRSRAQEYFYVGITLFILGVAITLISYFDLIDMGNYFILAFGPILGGGAIALKNYKS